MVEEKVNEVAREAPKVPATPKAPVVKPAIPQTKPTPKSATPAPVKPAAPAPKPKSNTVHDRNLIASLLYMKENKLMQESKANPHFDSIKEAEDYSKEEIISAIKDTINNIKEDISELQKKAGHELHLEGIKLLEIPLRIKVWESNPLKKDLELIYGILNPVIIKVNQLKKEFEARELEKDKREKIKEAEEAKPKPEDPNKIKPIPKFIKKNLEENPVKKIVKKQTLLKKSVSKEVQKPLSNLQSKISKK